MTDSAGKIREGEALDWSSLEDYLRAQLPGLSGDMRVAQFHGGHANLSYLIAFKEREYVLRRPPFGKLAPGAHDMKREYTVLSVLNSYYPPAPKAILYCEEESIIGAPFVLMERCTGLVIRYRVPEEFKHLNNIEQRLTDALIRAQAELHLVDYGMAGLSELGRPEGFLGRQVKAWQKRWQLINGAVPDTLTDIFEALDATVPTESSVSIIHNDFKFDNCQFKPGHPDKVSAVFDWDMTTLGDPLFDFASSLVYWPDPHLDEDKLPVLLEGSFPEKAYLIEYYAKLTSLDMSRFRWYECLAFAKTAVIAGQLYARYLAGKSSDKRMLKFDGASKAFIKKAESMLDYI